MQAGSSVLATPAPATAAATQQAGTSVLAIPAPATAATQQAGTSVLATPAPATAATQQAGTSVLASPAPATATQQAGTSTSPSPATAAPATTAASARTAALWQAGASTSPSPATATKAAPATTAAPRQTGASTSPSSATATKAATQRAGASTSAMAVQATAARADLAVEATAARRLGKTLEWKEVGHGKYDGLFTKVQSGDASGVQPITLPKKAWRAPKGTNFLGYDISDRVLPQIVIPAPSLSGKRISDERGNGRAPTLPMELVLAIMSLAADTQRELRGLRDTAALILNLPKGAQDPEIALGPVYIVPDWLDSRLEDFAQQFGLLPRLSDALCAKPSAVAARLNMMLIHIKQMPAQWEVDEPLQLIESGACKASKTLSLDLLGRGVKVDDTDLSLWFHKGRKAITRFFLRAKGLLQMAKGLNTLEGLDVRLGAWAALSFIDLVEPQGNGHVQVGPEYHLSTEMLYELTASLPQLRRICICIEARAWNRSELVNPPTINAERLIGASHGTAGRKAKLIYAALRMPGLTLSLCTNNFCQHLGNLHTLDIVCDRLKCDKRPGDLIYHIAVRFGKTLTKLRVCALQGVDPAQLSPTAPIMRDDEATVPVPAGLIDDDGDTIMQNATTQNATSAHHDTRQPVELLQLKSLHVECPEFGFTDMNAMRMPNLETFNLRTASAPFQDGTTRLRTPLEGLEGGVMGPFSNKKAALRAWGRIAPSQTEEWRKLRPKGAYDLVDTGAFLLVNERNASLFEQGSLARHPQHTTASSAYPGSSARARQHTAAGSAYPGSSARAPRHTAASSAYPGSSAQAPQHTAAQCGSSVRAPRRTAAWGENPGEYYDWHGTLGVRWREEREARQRAAEETVRITFEGGEGSAQQLLKGAVQRLEPYSCAYFLQALAEALTEAGRRTEAEQVRALIPTPPAPLGIDPSFLTTTDLNSLSRLRISGAEDDDQTERDAEGETDLEQMDTIVRTIERGESASSDEDDEDDEDDDDEDDEDDSDETPSPPPPQGTASPGLGEGEAADPERARIDPLAAGGEDTAADEEMDVADATGSGITADKRTSDDSERGAGGMTQPPGELHGQLERLCHKD
ncbi:hypothetical protein OC844_007506 [Tilletia horrida]|nr:hypothetical protein OC844_007506 [Tilletia horrida]